MTSGSLFAMANRLPLRAAANAEGTPAAADGETEAPARASSGREERIGDADLEFTGLVVEAVQVHPVVLDQHAAVVRLAGQSDRARDAAVRRRLRGS